MILSLKEIEFFFDPLQRFGDGKLQGSSTRRRGLHNTREKKINWISIIIIIRALLVSDGTTTHMKKKKGNNSLYYIIFLLFKVYVKKILICIKYNAGSYGVLLLTVQPSEQLNNREALEL